MKDYSASTDGKLTVLGYFEGIQRGHAIGWALLKEEPFTKLKIDVFCDDTIIASGFAQESRNDLKEIFQSDGLHLFKLPISEELFDHSSHVLNAVVSNTSVEISGGTRKTGRLKRKREFPIMSRAEGLVELEKLLNLYKYESFFENRDRILQAFTLGSLSQETGKYEESLRAWSMFEKMLGETAIIAHKISEAALFTQNYSLAETMAKKSIMIDDRFLWGHIGLGNVHFKKCNFIEAEKSYAQARCQHPNHVIFKTFATSREEMHLITQSEQMIAQGRLEEAARYLYQDLDRKHSPSIERKYSEILCLLKVPEDTQLDIAVKTEVKIQMIKMQLARANQS